MLKDFFEELLPWAFSTVSVGLIVYAIVVLALCWLVVKVVTSISGRALAKTKLEPGVKGFISALVKTLVWALAAIVAAGIFGIPVTSFVAMLSVAGLALSLSIQSQLSNLFSGINVLAVKPFLVGDYIEIAGAEGTVREIGLFATTIATVDNRLVHIPNSDITSSKITNYTHEELRRMDLKFQLSYDCDPEKVVETLLGIANAEGRILKDPAPFSALSDYKDSSIEYLLRFWCKGTDYWDLNFELKSTVGRELKARGLNMSYPHMNIHMVQGD